MSIAALLEKVLEHPAADQLADRLNDALSEEKRKRADFREWLTPSVKAEFINGEIVMHSPVKRAHLEASSSLNNMLWNYVQLHQLGKVDTEKAMIALGRNDFEPDICFWTADKTADWDDNTMIHPAPDLIVEILSKSTADRDRGVKFDAYESFGVAEYWIVDAHLKILEINRLTSDNEGNRKYVLDGPFGVTDTVTSQVLAGLSLPVAAIFDTSKSFAVVQAWLKA